MTLYSQAITATADVLIKDPKKSLPDAGTRPRSLFVEILFMRPGVRLALTALGLTFAAFGLAVPIAQKMAIDALTMEVDLPGWSPSQYFVLAFVGLAATRAIEFIVKCLGTRESVVVETWLSSALYRQALTLKSRHRHARTVGEVVALMSSHLTMVAFFLTDLFPMFFTSFIPIVAAPFVLAFFFDITPVPVLLLVATSLVICLFFARRSSQLFQNYKISDEQRLGSINEWIQNVKALRILGWTTSFEAKLEKKTRTASDQRIKVVTWAGVMNSFAEAVPHLLNITGVLTLLYFRDEPPSPGDVFGVLWVLGVFLIIPMRIMPWIFVLSLDASSSLRRIQEYLRLETDADGLDQDDSLTSWNPFDSEHPEALRVQGLNVKLEQHILKNIDFTLRDGEFLAIVGEVGAGKSQLLAALAGESEVSFAEFLIFGHSVETLTKGQRRSFFAIAPQDAFTMEASVHENVGFDYNPSPDAQVMRSVEYSLDLVEYGPDLELFHDHIHTQLGERGVNLSGGQKQRLGLARAHYSGRRILLLDDSISAVDAETEAKIIDKLFLREWKDRTRILVTHRLTVLSKVDRILFLQHGEVRGFGTWEELIQQPDFKEFVTSVTGNDVKE